MLDNSKLIAEHMHFRNEHDFYFIQILQRKKDNPENKKSVRVLNTYYVYSVEDFFKMMPDIIQMCEQRKARAYFNPNVLNDEVVALAANKVIAGMLAEKDYRNVRNAYNRACGSCTCAGEQKMWLIDLDGDQKNKVEEIREFLKSVQPNVGEDKIVMEVPTRHGRHLLVKPHDPRKFSMTFPGIDVHKDNPTVLYFPECLEDYATVVDAKIESEQHEQTN